MLRCNTLASPISILDITMADVLAQSWPRQHALTVSEKEKCRRQRRARAKSKEKGLPRRVNAF